MEISLQLLIEQLSGKGIRLSYQRIKVLEYLYAHEGHPTVEEIFQALSGDIPSLSKVTVYNTVHTLVDAGLVRVVDIDGAETRYDIILASHGHFLCTACRKIYNFEINIDQVPVTGLNGFQITQKNVTFRGVCPDCRNLSAQVKEM
jgi:Fur family peroxide stress response transcriptional regulator